jgi:acetylornithine deacetylase/succinyl-diaminopimelate desuccinylase-like protein
VIGVVTGIQGKKTFDIVIEGERGHAGTLAMADRRDALEAFSRMAMVLYAQIGGYDEAVKFTIGRLVVEPNAPSVVPERVSLRIDLRHPDNAVLELLAAAPGGVVRAVRHAVPRRRSRRWSMRRPTASTRRCSARLRRPPSASGSRTCPFFRRPATTRATWRRCARAR